MNVNALIALLRAHDLGIDARKSLVPRVHEVTVQLAGNQKRMTQIIQQAPRRRCLRLTSRGESLTSFKR